MRPRSPNDQPHPQLLALALTYRDQPHPRHPTTFNMTVIVRPLTDISPAAIAAASRTLCSAFEPTCEMVAAAPDFPSYTLGRYTQTVKHAVRELDVWVIPSVTGGVEVDAVLVFRRPGPAEVG